MRGTIIHNLPDWQVISYGNGLSYIVANLREERDLFFQGDDAEKFRNELDGLTENGNGPVLDYADALAVIWAEYGELV